MALYSKATQHAVSMLTYIARAGERHLSSVREVSEATGISEPTVAKTLQQLVKEGVLDSRKGPGGGFLLTGPSEKISLGRILGAVEGKEPFSECIAGLQTCNEDNVCPLHTKWIGVRKRLEEFLDTTTLRDMVSAVSQKDETRRRGMAGEESSNLNMTFSR